MNFFVPWKAYRQTFLGGEGSFWHGCCPKTANISAVSGASVRSTDERSMASGERSGCVHIGVQAGTLKFGAQSGKAAIGAARWHVTRFEER